MWNLKNIFFLYIVPSTVPPLFLYIKREVANNLRGQADKPNLTDVNMLKIYCVTLNNAFWLHLLLDVLNHRLELGLRLPLAIRLVLGPQQALSFWFLVNFFWSSWGLCRNQLQYELLGSTCPHRELPKFFFWGRGQTSPTVSFLLAKWKFWKKTGFVHWWFLWLYKAGDNREKDVTVE